ncbi:MAG: M48 family metalloprotease [Nitrospinae bacterium]|nr:M48 family metalloprotease [Nitrospinota bacterium]
MMIIWRCLRVVYGAAAVMVVAVLLASGPAYGQLGGLFGFTEDQEVELGRRAALEVEREFPLLDDPDVVAYIEKIGRKLVAVSGRANIPYTFKVVDLEQVNAISLPGGYVYVFRGLILAADEESELAGVMAHEVGHIVARHGVEQPKRSQLFGLGAAEVDFYASIGESAPIRMPRAYCARRSRSGRSGRPHRLAGGRNRLRRVVFHCGVKPAQ